MNIRKISIGSDHGGYEYKAIISKFLNDEDFEVIDEGTNTKDSCDYPVIAKKVAKKVAEGEVDRGILICGSGIGMSITANKTNGIRAALCSETTSARLSREHNNSNILCLGQRLIGETMAIEIVKIWLNTEFSGGRHQNRIDMIEQKGL